LSLPTVAQSEFSLTEGTNGRIVVSLAAPNASLALFSNGGLNDDNRRVQLQSTGNADNENDNDSGNDSYNGDNSARHRHMATQRILDARVDYRFVDATATRNAE
jgi:hypothetical protein